MPRKKGSKRINNQDFTINDSANAPKAVGRVKKSVATETITPELSWDQVLDDEYDIVEEVNEEGVKRFVYKKKRTHSKSEVDIDQRPGIVYPEIVWYLISFYVKPEYVGHFAGINKATYAITKCEYFWRLLYTKYCENHPKLPEKLRLENGYKVYGLRQRVIRALYHTYDVFVQKELQRSAHDSKPHSLIKRCCVNMWYCKGQSHWSVYFKLKKIYPQQLMKTSNTNFIEELGRIDANPEEDCQILQVICKSIQELPPLMGMTLSSVSVVLAQGFRHHKIHLGFNTGQHNVSKDILPEHSIILDSVISIHVFDWWHPKYPYFDNKLPYNNRNEESLPVLKKDFLSKT